MTLRQTLTLTALALGLAFIGLLARRRWMAPTKG